MKQVTRRQFGLTAAATMAGLSAAPLRTEAQSRGAIPVGVIFPTKSLIGRQGAQGATIAAEFVNADGGMVDGRQIQLVVYDTNYAPVEGVAAVQRLLTQDNVRLVTGEISSTVALAAIPVVQAENALLMLAVPKHPDVTKSGYDRVFRLNTTTVMDSASFNGYLLTSVAPRKVALLAENNDLGRLTVEDAKRVFGGKLVFTDIFEVKQSDFSAMAANVRGSGADLVCIAASNPEQSGNLIKSMADTGFKPKIALMPGLLNNDLPKIAGKAAEGVFSEDIYSPSIDNEVNRRFVKAYEGRYKAQPGKIEMLGFESIWVLAQAVRKAGTASDTKKIAQTLHAGSWTSPRGLVSFDGAGQASSSATYHVEVKGGQVVASKR